MIKEAIALLVDGTSLTAEQAQQVMLEILEGIATPAQFGALMIALRLKGETPDELLGFASAMRAKVTAVPTLRPVLDTCGTGGDGSGSFNISTAAAIVVAAAGVAVAKHGNRAMSSQCGSADVLEGLGVNISLGPAQVARSIEEVGFGFMFALLYHPTMRFAAPLRREIGVRTTFNLLGPLTNPAGARRQVLGVPSQSLAEKMARTLADLGTEHALVVTGDGGMDELSISGATAVWDVCGDRVQRYEVHPDDVGLERSPAAAIQGGDVSTNVRIITDVFAGHAGPARDVVVLNAGAALYAADRVTTLRDGVATASEILQSGAAAAKLAEIVAIGQRL